MVWSMVHPSPVVCMWWAAARARALARLLARSLTEAERARARRHLHAQGGAFCHSPWDGLFKISRPVRLHVPCIDF